MQENEVIRPFEPQRVLDVGDVVSDNEIEAEQKEIHL